MSNKISSIGRIMLVGNLSIFMIGMGFIVRAKIGSNLEADIFSILDASNSGALLGQALGLPFLGFGFTLLFGSAIVDFIGIKKMLLLSALGYIVGSCMIAGASFMEVNNTAHMVVNTGLMLTGLGWGAVEAASNPMIAAIDPENKTHRLNVLHSWWPAGIVIGGLIATAMGSMGIPWQANLILLIIPSIVLGALVLASDFPVTERVASGVSYADMFKEIFKQPMFVLFWLIMFATAATELAPGQWVDVALSRVVGMQGILLVVYISALMFVMRYFAGTLAKLISPIGILFCGSAFAAVGLYGLSIATSPLSAMIAATAWGIGVCYMWPTMLAQVNDRFPKGGAFFLGLLGSAGGLSIYYVLPHMGAIYDKAKIAHAGSAELFNALVDGSPEKEEILRMASVESFQTVAWVPVGLLAAFALVWIIDKVRAK